jgi:hypothetical protein
MANWLPKEFADLELLLDKGWALPTQQLRKDKRCESSIEELNSFYATIMARIEEIASCFNQFPLSASTERVAAGLMLMEIAPAVEVMKSPDIPTDFARERLIRPQTQYHQVVGFR